MDLLKTVTAINEKTTDIQVILAKINANMQRLVELQELEKSIVRGGNGINRTPADKDRDCPNCGGKCACGANGSARKAV